MLSCGTPQLNRSRGEDKYPSTKQLCFRPVGLGWLGRFSLGAAHLSCHTVSGREDIMVKFKQETHQKGEVAGCSLEIQNLL